MAEKEETLPLVIDALRAMQRQVDAIHDMVTVNQFTLIAALDEATRGSADRMELLERVVRRLETPTPNYNAAGPAVFPGLANNERALLELAGTMRRLFGLGQPAPAGSERTLS